MNCHDVKPFLTAFADGTPLPALAKDAAEHISACQPCRLLVQDLRAASHAVRALPMEQVSARFSERLTERVATASQRSNGVFSFARMREWLRINILWDAGHVLRPALALSAAAVAVIGFNVHGPTATPVARIPAAPKIVFSTVEPALITQCVAQHRNDAAAQPLTDSAAVNLADRMDDNQPDNGDATAGI